MAATHVRMARPDEGDERMAYVLRRHNCKNAFVMRAALNDPDLDMLLFPVGLVGYTMPSNVPFEVPSSSECGVCHKHLRIWFEWVAPQIWTPG